ncbi:hypothetical protein H634G_11554 [Metarhizium anisopliae BRIP 53293]|uniref:Uncharacterized protein n=1 Tax=Metarhizium anisopliae BRIP 53293 TaxID=1291518 RepID=A0A0D9NHW7_METAN|nr:hypothetical protein H634G_11554 [Metarhizium anisopliae BRIP 53293]KJK84897.1 hypothetical protein H633G_11282 [Metarhizium anisopliae BRIP 53284]
MRILAYIRQKRLKQPPGKSWVPVNIHIPFEVAGFALSFLSLSDRLSRIDYKLIQNGLFVIIGILDVVTRARRLLKIKVEKGNEEMLGLSSNVIPGDARYAMSPSKISRTDTIPSGSEIELVTRKENA